MSGDRIEVILDELPAARAAMDRAVKGELVVVFADRPTAIFEAIVGR